MRDLFSDPLIVPEVPPPVPEQPRPEKRAAKLAAEFVRWCCSFGRDFRNSPDITNLRFWIEKTKLKLKPQEEAELLDAAQTAFRKHIEQLMRRSETAV
jgi:hypothetical protein